MTKLSVKAKCQFPEKTAATTVSLRVDDLKFKATATNASFEKGLKGVVLGVEKPGVFSVDYDIEKKQPKFQFMSSAALIQKPLKLTYTHVQNKSNTLEGALSFDSKNKVTGKYEFSRSAPAVKYSYVHGGTTTLEPAYDFKSESWSFAVTHKVKFADTLKGTYSTATKNVGLEWTNTRDSSGPFKVESTIATTGSKKVTVTFEKTWNMDI